MIPLVLFSGFLGAGKTTFLENLLPQLGVAGLRPHVILNDYRNAGVDAARLSRLSDAVRPISGSCVCCSSREELLEMLEEIPLDAGGVLLIEANGTTDTEELVEILTLDRRAEPFTLPVQLAVIDGKRWQKRFWHNALEASQVRTAAHGFISRTDEITGARMREVERSLMKINPRLRRTAPEEFASALAGLAAAVAAAPARDHGREGQQSPAQVGTIPSPAPAHHHHHFASLEYRLHPTLDEPELMTALRALPTEVVRVKGVCYFTASPEVPRLFQMVGGGGGEIQVFPLDARPSVAPTIVLIGGALDEPAIRATLAGLIDG